MSNNYNLSILFTNGHKINVDGADHYKIEDGFWHIGNSDKGLYISYNVDIVEAVFASSGSLKHNGWLNSDE